MTTETSSEARSIPNRLDGVRSQKLLTLYSPQGVTMAQSVQLPSYRTWTVRGSKSWRGKIYTLLQRSDFMRTHPTCCLMSAEVLWWEIKRLGSDVEQLLPFSAEINNEWSYTSAPRTCLAGARRDGFKFYYLQSERPWSICSMFIWFNIAEGFVTFNEA